MDELLRALGLNLPQTSANLFPGLTQSEQDFATGFLDGPMREGKEKPSIAELIGLGVGLTPIGGITKFLKNGVPDVARRLARTDEAIDELISAGFSAGARSDDIAAAVRYAQKYPRTLAHNSSIVHNPELGKQGYAGLNRVSPDGQRMRIELGPMSLMQQGDPQAVAYSRLQQATNEFADSEGLARPKMESRGIFPFAHTFAHENQHTGQRLLNPRAKGLSLPAQGIAPQNHPVEIGARRGALKNIYGQR